MQDNRHPQDAISHQEIDPVDLASKLAEIQRSRQNSEDDSSHTGVRSPSPSDDSTKKNQTAYLQILDGLTNRPESTEASLDTTPPNYVEIDGASADRTNHSPYSDSDEQSLYPEASQPLPNLRSQLLLYAFMGNNDRLASLLSLGSYTLPPNPLLEKARKEIQEKPHGISMDHEEENEPQNRAHFLHLQQQINEAKDRLGRGLGHLAKDYDTLDILLNAQRDEELIFFTGALDFQDNTPLHSQTQLGHISSVEWLLAYQQSQLQAENKAKETPLFCAVRTKAVSLIKRFINLDASLQIKNYAGNLPLHIACYHDLPSETLKLIIDKTVPNLDIKDLQNNPKNLEENSRTLDEFHDHLTPLDIAIIQGSTETVKTLLAHKAYMIKEKELSDTHRRKIPLLHRAAQQESCEAFDIVEDILHYFDNANITDNSNNTALHIATQLGNTLMVDWLLEHGADPSIPNTDRNLPLHIACVHNYPEIAANLYQHFREITSNHIEHLPASEQESTPLDLAVQQGNVAVIERLFSHKMIPVENVTNTDTPSNMENGPEFQWPRRTFVESEDIEEFGQNFLMNLKAAAGHSLLQVAATKGHTAIIFAFDHIVQQWQIDTFDSQESYIITKKQHYSAPDYLPGLSPLELAFKAQHHNTAQTLLASSSLTRSTLCSLIMLHRSNNIAEILTHYENKPCCDEETAQAFFNSLFVTLSKKIQSANNIGSTDSDSADSDSFSAPSPKRTNDETQAFDRLMSALNHTYAFLEKDDFASMPINKQLDRVALALKLTLFLNERKRIEDRYGEKIDQQTKQALYNDVFASMSNNYHSDYLLDVKKLLIMMAIGAVLGSIIGLAISAGIALHLTANTIGTTLFQSATSQMAYTMTASATFGALLFGCYNYLKSFNEIGHSVDKLSQCASDELIELYNIHG